jgi:hypothetical protein
MTTVNNLIKRTLRKIGVYQAGEAVPPDEFADCLEELNAMLDSWSNNSLISPTKTRISKALTIGQASYTIGTGGDLNVSRPNRIEHAFVRDSSGNDFGLNEIGLGQYNDIQLKTESGMPFDYYFENSTPLARVYLFPVPDLAYTLYMDAWYRFTRYVANDDVTLPLGYEDAIVYNLAVRVASDFGKVLAPNIERMAESSLSRLKDVNALDIPIISTFPRSKFNLISG